ncbi:variable surface protein [Plasmodium gonderi]|uniref:Variable surface protein n=1 Tax=Plasmodium gonderi TaxID=77519 RepID=A0A1Y1JN84_PLAGO|nr:variable surface protein [Plasmodium gonderi]GAW83931.1 variable surface protein [Plasmodium gonderi]
MHFLILLFEATFDECMDIYLEFNDEITKKINSFGVISCIDDSKKCDEINQNVNEKNYKLKDCYEKVNIPFHLSKDDTIAKFINTCSSLPKCSTNTVTPVDSTAELKLEGTSFKEKHQEPSGVEELVQRQIGSSDPRVGELRTKSIENQVEASEQIERIQSSNHAHIEAPKGSLPVLAVPSNKDLDGNGSSQHLKTTFIHEYNLDNTLQESDLDKSSFNGNISDTNAGSDKTDKNEENNGQTFTRETHDAALPASKEQNVSDVAQRTLDSVGTNSVHPSSDGTVVLGPNSEGSSVLGSADTIIESAYTYSEQNSDTHSTELTSADVTSPNEDFGDKLSDALAPKIVPPTTICATSPCTDDSRTNIDVTGYTKFHGGHSDSKLSSITSCNNDIRACAASIGNHEGAVFQNLELSQELIHIKDVLNEGSPISKENKLEHDTHLCIRRTYTPFGKIFAKRKRKKRKQMNKKLQRILIGPSFGKERRIQFAYSYFEY